MKPKPILGQRLFSLNIGNNARHVPQVLNPAFVSKVGSKYFSVKLDGPYPMEREYHIEDWRERTSFSAVSKLYETEQEWNDEKETRSHWNTCTGIFRHGRPSLSLETLRKIAALVKAELDEAQAKE